MHIAPIRGIDIISSKISFVSMISSVFIGNE
jgi:hypothetical protein